MLLANIPPAKPVTPFTGLGGNLGTQRLIWKHAKQDFNEVMFIIEEKSGFSMPNYVIGDTDMAGNDDPSQYIWFNNAMTERFDIGRDKGVLAV